MSHWLLDFVVHRPDLPLHPGEGPMLGLGLWNSLPGTLGLELTLLALGLWIYLGVTAPRDATGRWALGGLVAVLVLSYAGSVFGKPPPSVNAVAWVGQAQWLLIAWGYWVDAHRFARLDAGGRAPGGMLPAVTARSR